MTQIKKRGKKWSAIECSILYHLIMWGYISKEVQVIAATFLPHRTRDSIHGATSEIRKWISKELGYPVSGTEVSETTIQVFREASNITPSPQLASHKRNNDFKPVHVFSPQRLGLTLETAAPLVQKELPQEPIPAKEPDILDVMKMAKELGAAEVEYKGMKIKY